MALTYDVSKWHFIRTCQSCGHEQIDTEPKVQGVITSAYMYRKCKICKSENLDYGSKRPWSEEAKAEYEAWEQERNEDY